MSHTDLEEVAQTRHSIFEQSMTVAFGQVPRAGGGGVNIKCKQLPVAVNVDTKPNHTRPVDTKPNRPDKTKPNQKNHENHGNVNCEQLGVYEQINEN